MAINSDLKISGSPENPLLNGGINISDFSVKANEKLLPPSNIDLKFNGNKIKIYSKLISGTDEITELVGNFVTGKSPAFELNCKSNAKLMSLISIVDSILKSVGNNQFNTLSASGQIDADFYVKSDLKKVFSSGYLKLASASLAYKLYNILIDKISADIQFANNTIDIKKSGFTILGQPMNIFGTSSSDANADLSIIADKLQLKGLLLALGQTAVLKENNINSGTVSANATIKGKLNNISPKINIDIDNLNLKNIPSDTHVILNNANTNIQTDGKKYSGKIGFNNLKFINQLANVSVPDSKISIDEKNINLDKTYILLNNSRIDITGKISDYMSKAIGINIDASGNLLASDIKTMIPKEFHSEVKAKGSLPLLLSVKGNEKNQNIIFKLNANPNNYLSLFDVQELQGKNTEIKANMSLSGSTLKFSDTGIFANGVGIAYLKGVINDLYKSQDLSLNLSTPNISMSVPFVKNSKLTAGGSINISGKAINPILRGDVSIPVISIPDMLLTMKDMSVSLDGAFLKGKGTLKEFVCGGIKADSLSSDFKLQNNLFYLNNLSGNAFDGKVEGDISYNILNGLSKVVMKGSGMNAEKAIAGSAGLKNAMSGKLNFNANVTTKGETDVQLMKNLKGKATFEINEGEFGNIGRFGNFLLAQNLLTNPVIKAGVNSVRSLPVIKGTANYKFVKGNLRFNDGWAALSPVKTSGPSMSYYITGKYNLLNATANVVVLGRISAEVVKLLGPLGDLSLSKLTSLIPGIGTSTSALVQAITTNPYGEKVSEIPELSSGNSNYKNFKVIFNGGVESTSSVKSFKWLSVCDTSEIESFNLKDQVKNTKQAIQDAKQQQIDNFNKKLEEQRKQAQEDAQQVKDAVDGLKNLFKSPKNKTQETVQ